MEETKEVLQSPMEALIGKEVTWTSQAWYDNTPVKCVIAAAHEDIGITIVNATDPEDHFTCIRGPLSPGYKGVSSDAAGEWERQKEYFLTYVPQGIWDRTVYLKDVYNETPEDDMFGSIFADQPDADNCAF